MARQAQSQQKIGFAIGGNATAPQYVIPARSYSETENAIYNSVMATLGSLDRLYAKELTGFDSIGGSFTIPMDLTVCPVLLASFLEATTVSGTSPDFTNTLVPRNNDGSGNPSIEGKRLTFFYYDADNGLKKHENVLISEITITNESNQINLEVTVAGERLSTLAGADLTTAEAGFAVTTSTLGTLVKPANLVISYDNDTAFGSPTNVSQAQMGSTITLTHNVQSVNRQLTASGDLLYPTVFLGGFSAGFEFTQDVVSDDLRSRYLNSTETAFRFVYTKSATRELSFVFAPTALMVASGDKTGDSNDPVMQTVTLETAKNGITEASLTVAAKGSQDLTTI